MGKFPQHSANERDGGVSVSNWMGKFTQHAANEIEVPTVAKIEEAIFGWKAIEQYDRWFVLALKENSIPQ